MWQINYSLPRFTLSRSIFLYDTVWAVCSMHFWTICQMKEVLDIYLILMRNSVSRFATFLQNNSVIIQAHGLQFDQGLILESEWSFSPVDIISPIWNASGWNPCRFHSQSEISTFSQRKKLAVTLLKFSKSRNLILAAESSRTPQRCDSNSFIIMRFYLSFVAKLVLLRRFFAELFFLLGFDTVIHRIITVIQKIDKKRHY